MNKRINFTMVLLSFLLLGLANAVLAVPITFLHEGTHEGGVLTADTGAVNVFEPGEFLITATGDTGDRLPMGSGFFIDHLTASIAISGVGTFNFVSPTRTFLNTPQDLVGFSRAGIGGLDLFNGPDSAAFAGWDMLSSIGPISGSGDLLQWTSSDVLVDGGTLAFVTASAEATFTAIVRDGVPVPAPASLFLVALGLLGIRSTRRRA